MTWGVLRIGRMSLSEKYTLSEQTNAGTGERTIQIDGQHFTSWKGASTADVKRCQEDLHGLAGQTVAVTFEDKTDHNGYYRVHDVGAETIYWPDEEMYSFNWNFILTKLGPDNAADVESRLGSVVRANDFALLGERWHAPAIGHYGYFTGTTPPVSSFTRTGVDGPITVYRGIPAGRNPRWGCAVADFPLGRVRLLTDGSERSGIGIAASPMTWELNNGLVRVLPLSANGMFSIGAWGGTAWETKAWHVARGGTTTTLGIPDQMTVLRNDFEMVTIRIIKNGTPGRTLVDLTLRRGSRFVELSIQSDSSTTLGAYLETVETATDNTATGYVVATNNDPDGNKFIVGSSKTVAYTVDRGISKAASVSLDVYIGAVLGGSGAVAGDAASVLRDQYIGATSETTMVVRR